MRIARKGARKAASMGAREGARRARSKAAAALAAAALAAVAGSATALQQAAVDTAGDVVGAVVGGGAEVSGDSVGRAVAHRWSAESAPLYYTVRGKARTSPIKAGEVRYSKLDALGRTQQVTAKVTYKMVADSAGWREEMPVEADEISGWGHNRKVAVSLSDGRVYKGYAFNRSHLLADSLGGHAVKENLVTATRTQNVGNNTQSEPGGMQYTETKALDYLRAHHKGWVYYKATPVYKGSELVCRSVYVDVKSDDGSVDERVEVYNAMNGYSVDYATGEIEEER